MCRCDGASKAQWSPWVRWGRRTPPEPITRRRKRRAFEGRPRASRASKGLGLPMDSKGFQGSPRPPKAFHGLRRGIQCLLRSSKAFSGLSEGLPRPSQGLPKASEAFTGLPRTSKFSTGWVVPTTFEVRDAPTGQPIARRAVSLDAVRGFLDRSAR